jgi:hypothetical protein
MESNLIWQLIYALNGCAPQEEIDRICKEISDTGNPHLISDMEYYLNVI